jgi:transcriptional regulator with XRE-family HTH domain
MSLSAMVLDIFARRLRELRLSRHMTLQNVGDAVGSQPNTISNLENAQKAPSLNMVLALADFFGVSVDYLVGRTDVPAPFDPRLSDLRTLTQGEEPAESQTKLYSMVGALREDGIEKALSYIAFLRYAQRKEDRKKRLDST